MSSPRVIKSKHVRTVAAPPAERPRFIPAAYGNGDLPPGAPRRSRAETMRIESEKKIEAAVKDAYERGHAEGFRKGVESREKELGAASESLRRLLLEVDNVRRSILERGEARVLGLVIAVARKVIRQEVATHDDIVLNVLREAVRSVLDRDRIKLRLHPLDRDAIAKHNPALIPGFEGIRSIVLEPDETLGRGGAVIETSFGEVDASIERQLEEILQAFTNASRA